MHGNICPENFRAENSSLAYSLVVWCLLLPFSTLFARNFWKKLGSEKDVVMLRATKVYIVCATTQVWLAALENPILPLLQFVFAHNVAVCAVARFGEGVVFGVAYIALQRILLRRLQLAFANTDYAITDTVAKSINVLHCAAFLLFAYFAYQWSAPCNLKTRIYELPNKHFKGCQTGEWTHLMVTIALAVTGIIGGNLLLARMYVWRVEAMFLKANEKQLRKPQSRLQSERRTHVIIPKSADSQNFPEFDANGAEIELAGVGEDKKEDSCTVISGHQPSARAFTVIIGLDILRKSAVVAMVSVLSTVADFAVTHFVPFKSEIGPIDIIVNEVLIYCLFSFGDDLYDQIFPECFHWAVDVCLPKHALDVETDVFDSCYNEESDNVPQHSGGHKSTNEFIAGLYADALDARTQQPMEAATASRGTEDLYSGTAGDFLFL